MALNKIKLSEGKFLYRCEFCPFEFPPDPVKEHELGAPPPHRCTGSNEVHFDMKDILSDQKK